MVTRSFDNNFLAVVQPFSDQLEENGSFGRDLLVAIRPFDNQLEEDGSFGCDLLMDWIVRPIDQLGDN